MQPISPILHELAVPLGREGYIDYGHPLWTERHAHIPALRQIFLPFGLELIEDLNGAYLYTEQMATLPSVDGETPVPTIPLRRTYPLKPPGIALMLALRGMYADRVKDQDVAFTEFRVEKEDVILRASHYWTHYPQEGMTTEKLKAALDTLCQQYSWLKGPRTNSTVVISPVIEAMVGVKELAHLEETLTAWLNSKPGDSEPEEEP